MLAVLIVGFFVLGYFGLLLGQQRYRRIKPPNVEDSSQDESPSSVSNLRNNHHAEEYKDKDRSSGHSYEGDLELQEVPL
ncbi:hypothetical protein EON65_26330 [archaeon]|nr:MAG: hypothetical protein EON65_26330 [archaeon]